MNSRILIIYEYQILYQILKEIDESLNFEIIQSNNKDFKELKFIPENNYLIITRNKIEGIQNDTTQQSSIDESTQVSDMDDEIPF